MKKLRESIAMKCLCYVLIPILFVILITSIAGVIITTRYSDTDSDGIQTFTETEAFGEEYLDSVISEAEYINDYMESEERGTSEYFRYNKIEVNNYDKNVYYKAPDYYYNSLIYSYISYIIVDNQTGDFYTNIKSKDYQKEIENIQNQKIYWKYENNKITTQIGSINEDNIKYLEATYSYYSTDKLNNMSVYTWLDEEAFNYSNSFALQQTIYNLFQKAPNATTILIPVTSIGLIVMIIYLCWAIGYEKGKDKIELNRIDKLSYEILFLIVITVVGILMSLLIASAEFQVNQKILIPLALLEYLGSYTCLAVLFVSTIKRIKAKEFWHTFLVYRIYKWIKDTVKKFINKMTDKSNLTKKIVIAYIAFVLISIILISVTSSFFGFLLLMGFWIWVLYMLIQYSKKLNNIQKALKDIYEGNSDIELNEEELSGVLKQMAEYINDIAGGFTNAINESLKSERLKTELITNVSHDIKTPLTSIINYVDLLKKEDIKDAKIEQYIAILDKKSQRLKKLIEDLVEASKVSSGNVKLNMETINLKELINQAIGEYEDKFKKKQLKLDMDISQEEIKIQADNRYMYRIIDNLFSNITKYAMDNTRIYIRLEKTSSDILLEIKNISATKLNISADELMQRFVRGDKSRYTEGSGLGLSIAESLTEIQGGKFKIAIDGDLFKVQIRW